MTSSPALASDGTVYFGSWNDKLYALRPDGSKKWEFSTGGDIESSPAVAPDGTVYVGSRDDRLYAIRPDGSKKWEFLSGGDVFSSPAVASDGTIYFASDDGRLYALRADGSKKWEFSTGSLMPSSPAIGSDGTVYIGSWEPANKLIAILPDGTKRWEFTAGSRILSSPAIAADGTVYFGAYDGKLYSLRPDGSKKWDFQTGYSIRSSPAIGLDGTVYVGSNDNKLYALGPDGVKLWDFSTGGQVWSSPAISGDGALYSGSNDGKLYALGSTVTASCSDGICLQGDRFIASVSWRDHSGRTGVGHAAPYATRDSGLFWFFSPENWELLVKVLDGCPMNSRFWVFSAASTDVEYTLTVTDRLTGMSKRYTNPLGRRSDAFEDTDAFASCGAAARSPGRDPENSEFRLAPEATTSAASSQDAAGLELPEAGCTDTSDAVCLAQGRFLVRVRWEDFQGNTGVGAVTSARSTDSAVFSFFGTSNWELLVKVLDGCGVNGEFWVYGAAATTVAYTLTVTDTLSGVTRTYSNPRGQRSPAITDASAFSSCSIPSGLPPDPGPAGATTVAGIDSDHDGLRDDVQRYIAIGYANTPAAVAPLQEMASAMQSSLSSSRTPDSSAATAERLMRASECLVATAPNDSYSLQAALLGAVVNTDARLREYLRFGRALSGQVFRMRPPAEWASSCVGAQVAAPPEDLPWERSASVCTTGGNSIYFANGINTTFNEAVENLQDLESRARATLPPADLAAMSFALAYNHHASFLLDLWEAAQQRGFSDATAFLRWLAGLEVMPDVIQDLYSDALRSLTPTTVVDSTGLANHLALYRTDFLEGRKVVVVAHSQGNFFANAAWNALSSAEKGYLGVIGVANPDTYVAGDGLLVNVCTDFVVLATHSFVPPLGCDVRLPDLRDLMSHSFSRTYLKAGSDTEEDILNGLGTTLARLTQPPSQAQGGVITVTLTWGAQPDVDLHAFEPNGTHVYYARRQGVSGFLDLDDITGYGPEHYYVGCSTVESGTYRIGVNYYHGLAPETASIQIRAGLSTRTIQRLLASDRGSAGDSDPTKVANIVVTGSAQSGYSFDIVEQAP